MSVPGIGPRFRTSRVRAIAVGVVVLAELAIALPFLFVSPSTVRGVPGPLLVLLGVASAFVMGPRIGAALTAFAVLLAVVIVGENAYTEPLVWIPVAVGVGIVGDRVRRGDDLRRALLGELRRGLVTVSREPQVGPYRIVSRYVPGAGTGARGRLLRRDPRAQRLRGGDGGRRCRARPGRRGGRHPAACVVARPGQRRRARQRGRPRPQRHHARRAAAGVAADALRHPLP